MQDLPDWLPLFSLSAVAVFLEAAPFLLLGSLIGGLVEVFVPAERAERFAPRSAVGGTLFGLGLGLLVPTCECGVVPIARRLLGKGLPAQTALAYMLAAPVVNPVVVLATWTAFRGDLKLTAARVGLVVLAAGTVALLAAGRSGRDLLRADAPLSACGCGCGGGEPARAAPPGPLLPTMADAAGLDVRDVRDPPASAWRRVAGHVLADFLGGGTYLLYGAFASAAFKTFLPPETMSLFEESLWLAVPTMMLLALLLSVCSEADAFVAASFTAMPAAGQLAFVAYGPMVDLKLLAMYAAAFERRTVLLLVLGPTVLVWLGSMAFGLGGRP